jgi:hypothetical protein
MRAASTWHGTCSLVLRRAAAGPGKRRGFHATALFLFSASEEWMTSLDVLALVLTVTATVGMIAWCLALERRAAASQSDDDSAQESSYLLGCEYWIAMDVAPALARRRGHDGDTATRRRRTSRGGDAA